MASVILQEKANFTRLSRLLVDKGTEALRNTLDAIHAPANLPAILNANKATLLRLKPRVINDTQWDLLFPPSGNPADSKTFDVTLLTILFRNLSGLPPPATGWNAMPPDGDNSIQANITRIKLFRNQVYGHVAKTQVDNTTSDHLWLKISKALVGLKIPLKEIDELKTCPLGPEEEIYEQSLKEWFLKEEESKDMLDNLARNVYLMHDQLRQSVLQQKDDRENMEHLRQVMGQSYQGIQQLCTSSSSKLEHPKPMSDSGGRKVVEKHPINMDERLLQGLAKHNFKSKIKRKVKFFHPGTREWLLKQIYSWFELEDESRLLLITAGPGFGKSVFAAKVCEIFEEKGKLAACHFCDFSNSNLKDPMMMMQSLASHMCQNIVGFKEKLLDQLKRPHKVRGLKDAFQIYLQNPLDELEVEPSLIVIDGLDESATDDKSDMVKLIADNFPDLPECFKVLVTSRPELYMQGLDHVKKIKIGVTNMKNVSDILEYLRFCLPTLAAKDDAINRSTRNESPLKILPQVVKKCEGSFLYAFHVQQELYKRKDLGMVKFQEVMSFLPKGMGSVYHDYFHRLERELEDVMKRNPDLFKILELLVAIDTTRGELPLKFIARALDLPLDCRETKKIINKVNSAVSCLLYVSDDFITGFHKSIYDWLVAEGYDEHEYTVKVSDGKKRLWLVCEQVFKEIKNLVSSGKDLKLTNEVKHSLEHGHKYLLACDMRDSFSWLVDMIIVHVFLTVYPKSIYDLHWALKQACCQNDPVLSIQLRQRISWHVTEMGYLSNSHHSTVSEFETAKSLSYLENVLKNSPQGCFTDEERNIAELILTKSSRCVKQISVGMNSLSPLFTIILKPPILAVGVSSSKRLAAVALKNGTICVLSLPELITLWQYSTEYNSISCCTFAPDDTYILYGKLEKVINIEQRQEVTFFSGQVERFKSCAFSPNGKRLLTNNGSNTLKLWDVVRRSLVAVLSAGAPVDRCRFTNTGLFIVGGTTSIVEDTYWNSITLQRIDQRIYFSSSKRRNKDGFLGNERCNRCFQQECKEIIPIGVLNFDEKRSKIFTGIYKEFDCIFYLHEKESLHISEMIHFQLLAAWEIFVKTTEIFRKDVPYFDIAAIEDDHWLYSDDEKLVLFSCLSPNQSRPACVRWCSFSPDGAELATCTLDGFINLWNVATSQVYQRFRSGPAAFSAACWWSDKYLFVCHVTDTIPSLSRYPVDGSLKIVVNERQSLPLCSVNDEFLPFSGFLDFYEGYLSFRCGETEPVKVLDIREIGHPKKIMLPGIQPMMNIAVSAGASFVLATTGDESFLWKKSENRPDLYSLFLKRKLTFDVTPNFVYVYFTPFTFECCFSNDGKFALVTSSMWSRRGLFVIDLDSGNGTWKEIFDKRKRHSCRYEEAKIFCSDTVVLSLTPNLVEILCLKTWERLDLSFQRHLTKNSLLNSRLSPKGTILAVPTLSGDMEFLQLGVPK